MTAPVFTPFNFAPVNTDITTTSYTVPSSTYSKISAAVLTGWLLLNGTAIRCGGHNSGTLDTGAATLTTGWNTFYTCPTNRIYKATITITRSDATSGNAAYSLRVLASDNSTVRYAPSAIGGVANGGTATFNDVYIGPGDKVQLSVDDNDINGNSTTIAAMSFTTDAPALEMMGKEGDVFALSSATGSILYQEYAVAS